MMATRPNEDAIGEYKLLLSWFMRFFFAFLFWPWKNVTLVADVDINCFFAWLSCGDCWFYQLKFFFNVTFFILEHHLVNTDSLSDILKSSSISSTKSITIKEVCLIIDLTETQENYEHRKMAYEQVKLACQSVAANLHLLQFGKLDFVSYNLWIWLKLIYFN